MFHGWLIIFPIFSSLQNARDSNKETKRLEKLSAWKRINLKNILFLHSRVRLDVLFNIPYDTVTKPLKLALTLILYLFSSILIFENKGKYYSCLLHVFNFKTREETKEQFQPPKKWSEKKNHGQIVNRGKKAEASKRRENNFNPQKSGQKIGGRSTTVPHHTHLL